MDFDVLVKKKYVQIVWFFLAGSVWNAILAVMYFQIYNINNSLLWLFLAWYNVGGIVSSFLPFSNSDLGVFLNLIREKDESIYN